MDLNFYSELPEGCAPNVDSEFLDSEAYGEYSESKFAEGNNSYLSINVSGHPFLSSEQTFHTPSLGDEVFEIPPISLDPDPDPTLSMSASASQFELADGSDSTSGPRSLVSNLVVEANDPSFASTFVNSGPQGLEQLHLGPMGQAGGGGALLSSSALELGSSNGSHFSSSSPMTIDIQLGDVGHGLLGSTHLASMNQSELAMGVNTGHHSQAPEQPLSATLSPAGSLQDEDMDNFKRSVLVDSPVSLTSSSVLSHVSSLHPHAPSVSAASGRGRGKLLAAPARPAGGKKAREDQDPNEKKDPNEPQKPVSAYALFFRDTQAAIKGQNPNATFGEVSKIVVSMWDSLAEEQKQVYKRNTELAKRDYLKALAVYRANQLLQPATEEASSTLVIKDKPSSPPLCPATTHSNLEENSRTSLCASNIILDVPEVTTRSRAGAAQLLAPAKAQTPAPGKTLAPAPGKTLAPAPGRTLAPAPAPAQSLTKIIITKHILQGGGQLLTVLPGGARALQPGLGPGAPRQPPPLQQMQSVPPLPRLQQMVPPPLQAKPREGGAPPGLPMAITVTPPLHIKIIPATLQAKDSQPIIVPNTAAAAAASLPPQNLPGQPQEEEAVPSQQDEMEVEECGSAALGSVCVRAGCNKPAVESADWDREYCSNQCVADHCRDIFMAWCSIRGQSMATVK